MEVGFQTGRYLSAPEFLSLIITFQCNFQCKSCSIWQKKEFNELSIEEWLEIVDNLKNSFGKNTFIELNGGEPLLKKELVFKLIKDLKKYFRVVALNSNGSLINQEIIKELENEGLDILKISFYSLNKEIHNFLRGSDLAYERAHQAIKLVSQSKIRLEVGILIASHNIKEIPELIKYLNGFNNISIILQPLCESIESVSSKNKLVNILLIDMWPMKEDIENIFKYISKNNKNIKNSLDNIKAIKEYYLKPKSVLSYRCFAGQRNTVIYPNGDVALCFKRNIIGNIKNESIKKILSEAIQERKNIKRCGKYCRIIGCNFSRGIIEYVKDRININ